MLVAFLLPHYTANPLPVTSIKTKNFRVVAMFLFYFLQNFHLN